MLLERDHGLSRIGVAQAGELHQKVQQCSDASEMVESVLYKDFLNCDIVASSPLTRALQTATIALRSHKIVQTTGLRLLRNAREVKSAIGLDTMGKVCGAHIRPRLEEELRH